MAVHEAIATAILFSPGPKCGFLGESSSQNTLNTLRESNMAMENGPFICDFLAKPPFIGNIPLPCLITRGYHWVVFSEQGNDPRTKDSVNAWAISMAKPGSSQFRD